MQEILECSRYNNLQKFKKMNKDKALLLKCFQFVGRGRGLKRKIVYYEKNILEKCESGLTSPMVLRKVRDRDVLHGFHVYRNK